MENIHRCDYVITRSEMEMDRMEEVVYTSRPVVEPAMEDGCDSGRVKVSEWFTIGIWRFLYVCSEVYFLKPEYKVIINKVFILGTEI